MKLAELSQKLGVKRHWLDLALACEMEPGVAAAEHARRLGICGKAPRAGASRILNDPRMVEYRAALRAEVNARAAQTVKPIEAAVAIIDAPEHEYRIASLAEVLQILTDQARCRPQECVDRNGNVIWERVDALPPGVVKGLEMVTTTSEEGQVTTRTRILFESPQAAARELRAHHVGTPPEAPRTLNVNVIRALSDDDLDEIERRLTGARMRALASIPVEARPSE